MGLKLSKVKSELAKDPSVLEKFVKVLNRWNKFTVASVDAESGKVVLREAWATQEFEMDIDLTMSLDTVIIRCTGKGLLTGYTVEVEQAWSALEDEDTVFALNTEIENLQRQLLLSRFKSWPLKDVTLHMVCNDILKAAKSLASRLL